VSPPEREWEECLDIPRAQQILEGAPSTLYDPDTPGAAVDLGISQVDQEFLTRLESFIDEL
jgi:hypothetical protein